ncbi:sulfatase-like hydrolase/transferase [Panacibacter ginsenosidivorans]|uniref:Sulfatase-like hydrolase/transferase n=1 Tax=Panacibacter ginsenosidivorans TaxID=1813871 RepID=A0A5B8VGC5_9BACT|nr:sulfatase-like hydrolase/transferase [Panacibacter ginsenosidivorans]QEC69626.1 sulfatase-like hydrolase/transferase [Panacibacter ginsenosidivorans]
MRTFQKLIRNSFCSSNYSLFFLLAAVIFFSGCNKEFKENNTSAAINATGIDDARSSKPNIVLILSDDVGYEIPTYTGGQSYITPNLDKLSHAGMQFTQCYSSPMCSPSRVMLLTGKYNFRNYTGWGALSLDQRTFANMFKTAGYNTYVAGKWQLDNGDLGVHTFGFDEYIIFNPYEDRNTSHDNSPLTIGRYKSPELYVNGAYLNPDSVIGKYCDDILVDSITSYAAKSKAQKKPFFIYYPMSLAHDPFSPTPDDPEYATWDNSPSNSDTSFFPSMINYMDKKVGQLIRRFDSMGLTKSTIFIFIGDNGTPHYIFSQYKGQTVQGGKQQTTIWGTHVPMLVYWKGHIKPNTINNNLVDFTDFLSTFADLAQTPKPTTYGQLDGVSFYNSLIDPNTKIRDWVFDHYNNDRYTDKPTYRFAQNSIYKLYDSSGLFYNIVTDPYEDTNIPVSKMTAEQLQLRNYFQSIMDSLH